jgi:hypothetical protein
MKTPLQNQFEIQLKSLTGFDFQNAVIEIFLLKYGETDFTIIRLQNDKGADGIVESEKRVIACFGPKTISNAQQRHKRFEDKINSDFELYQSHWQSRYPNWSVVVNHSIDPQYNIIVKNLTSNGTVIGLEQLLSMINSLKNHQKRQLGKYFRIENEYFRSDYLHDFLEDILKESEISGEEIKYDKTAYISARQKIELNYDTADIHGAINEFEFLAEEGLLKLVNDLMASYNDGEINSMKNKILYDYNNQTNGSFKNRLRILSEQYCSKYSSNDDDDYLLCIRAVLITLFEQCLIGKKVKQV